MGTLSQRVQFKNFFAEMKGFSDFAALSDDNHFQVAPSDWYVVITDVEGSTRAIEEGRYKIVNMVGASSIAAVVNAVGSRELPFVFGGDGTTALIPRESLAEVQLALNHSRRVSKEEHGLKLRIGLVPHSELLAAGAPVRVAKYQLNPNNAIAFLKGDGVTLAETWVKSGRFILDEVSTSPSFEPHEGLSCRWAPLNSQHGEILSILIKPSVLKAADLRGILHELDHILDFDSHDSNPIKPEELKGGSLWKASRLEAGFSMNGSGLAGQLKIMFMMLFVMAIDRGIVPASVFDTQKYRRSVVSNSDFRKFDELLRFVVDVNADQRRQIEAMLEREFQAGHLVYGLHSSPSALMTCFVQNPGTDDHIHFVDGGDGGYAMAAKGLKDRMKKISKAS